MKGLLTILLALGLCAILAGSAGAAPVQGGGFGIPKVSVNFDGTDNPQDLSTAVKLMLLFTVLSILPSVLVMITSFTRIVVVLGFLRQALGTHTAPSNQVMIGLALFLSFFVMYPVFNEAKTQGLDPYMQNKITYEEAAGRGFAPFRNFMLAQTNEKDLALFAKASAMPKPDNIDDVPSHVIIPAFMTSELRTAFMMGFLIYLPFLIIDMIVASTLMSMGMMMLPPVMISLPFKLMVFVLADGWILVVGSLLKSFNV